MALQIVFSSNLDPATANLSVEFQDATAFLIEAPGITSEIEIDCYLQIYLTGINGELVRNIPLGKISESAVLLNISDTETVNTIPSEYLDSGLVMKLLFLASSTTFLYAYIIKPDCTLATVCNGLNRIEQRLTAIEQAIAVSTVTPLSASVSNEHPLRFLRII